MLSLRKRTAVMIRSRTALMCTFPKAKQTKRCLTVFPRNACKKVRQLIEYSLHDEYVSRFRRMMTIEQFRNAEFAAMYSERYLERLVRYHAGLFRALIKSGTLIGEDPDTLALEYVAPVVLMVEVCDRQPEREAECLKRLEAHVRISTVHIRRIW